MYTAVKFERNGELTELCSAVRTLVTSGEFEECMYMLAQAMEENPHNPEPHNLMGIVLEHMGDHCTAMKHFRAAWALDPTYRPTSQNLNNYGTFYSSGICAYDESDCEPEKSNNYMVEYGDHGVAHVIRRS